MINAFAACFSFSANARYDLNTLNPLLLATNSFPLLFRRHSNTAFGVGCFNNLLKTLTPIRISILNNSSSALSFRICQSTRLHQFLGLSVALKYLLSCYTIKIHFSAW